MRAPAGSRQRGERSGDDPPNRMAFMGFQSWRFPYTLLPSFAHSSSHTNVMLTVPLCIQPNDLCVRWSEVYAIKEQIVVVS